MNRIERVHFNCAAHSLTNSTDHHTQVRRHESCPTVSNEYVRKRATQSKIKYHTRFVKCSHTHFSYICIFHLNLHFVCEIFRHSRCIT